MLGLRPLSVAQRTLGLEAPAQPEPRRQKSPRQTLPRPLLPPLPPFPPLLFHKLPPLTTKFGSFSSPPSALQLFSPAKTFSFNISLTGWRVCSVDFNQNRNCEKFKQKSKLNPLEGPPTWRTKVKEKEPLSGAKQMMLFPSLGLVHWSF